MMKGVSHGGTSMHTVAYTSNEITCDEGTLQEYSVTILIWGIGIGSHDDEGCERGRGGQEGCRYP